MNYSLALGYVPSLSHLQSQKEMTKLPAKRRHPPPSSAAQHNSGQAAPRTACHWRKAMALQMWPQQPGLTSSLCLGSTRSPSCTQHFIGTAAQGSLPGAAAHQRPAPLTLCAALNAKHRGRVLKTKFCRALLRLGMTFVNERAFWTPSSLGTCLRLLSRKAKQPFDKYR